ncbi:uncharacterized protein [Henckelia pumila]|uniref:uncharacterized protein n=1 Tax=Henckelia pumila TaxID=405737 RepID=UPI003C6E3A84
MDIPSISYLKLLTLLVLLISTLHPNAESQWVQLPPKTSPATEITAPSPLCASQLALVNHACTLVVYTPSSPPAHVETLRNEHRRRHSRHRPVEEVPAETECCRWIKEVDDECVCDLLVRLPPFLTKPVHSYTIAIDDTCDVTFTCGSKS